MRPLTALSLTLVIFWGMSARAQDEKDCYRSDIETGQCLVKVLKSADADLKESYKYAYAKRDLSQRDRTNLMAAERAWIAYRNAACKAEYGVDRDKNLRVECIIKLTKLRADDIKYLYDPPCLGPPSNNFPEPPIVPVQTDLRSLPLK